MIRFAGGQTTAFYEMECNLISLLSSPMAGWLASGPITKKNVWDRFDGWLASGPITKKNVLDRFPINGWGFSSCENVATKGNVSATVFVGPGVANSLVVDHSIDIFGVLADACELPLVSDDWFHPGPCPFDSKSSSVNLLGGPICLDSCCSADAFVQEPVGRRPTIKISGSFDQYRAFLASDWFHGYRSVFYCDWFAGARVFLDAYKNDLNKSLANSCGRFAQLCRRAVRLSLLLGRYIEIAFHKRLIQPRALQTLVGA